MNEPWTTFENPSQAAILVISHILVDHDLDLKDAFIIQIVMKPIYKLILVCCTCSAYLWHFLIRNCIELAPVTLISIPEIILDMTQNYFELTFELLLICARKPKWRLFGLAQESLRTYHQDHLKLTSHIHFLLES